MAKGTSKSTTKASTGKGPGGGTGGAPAARRAVQQAQQPQNQPTDAGPRGLGALSKREQQNLGRWIGGAAQLLTKAGIDVSMSQPAA